MKTLLLSIPCLVFLASCASQTAQIDPVAEDLEVVSRLPDGERIKEDRSGNRLHHVDPYHDRESQGFVTVNKPF